MWLTITLHVSFISCLLTYGVHCQFQYFRVRSNDSDPDGQNVDFQCHVANKASSMQRSKDDFLLVPPQAISINDLPAGNNIEVRQGDKVVLYCKAVGSKPTELVWYKNENELFDEEAQTSFDEDKHRRYKLTSSITVYPAVDDNGAIYSCEARHPSREKSPKCSVAINVLHAPGPPVIEGYIEGDVVTSGDTLTLACITRGGNPPPHLVWSRGNVQVDATYTVKGHVTTNIHTFRVDASDNNGVYRCEASSIMTKEVLTATVKLSVHFPAANVKLVGPVEAKRGDTVTMTCTTDISNPPSQISWVVDGSLVVGGEELTMRVQDGWVTSSNLTITLTRQDPDIKTFACYAENPPVRKKTFRNHKLVVTYPFPDPPQPPTIMGYEESSSLRVGELQTFTCVALGGNPPATLKWYRGDREISAPTNKKGSGVSSELVIRVEATDNGALYRCEANNTATEMPLVTFVKLLVHFPPTNVTVTVRPCDPIAGDDVTLECLSSSSNPLSRISWKRDGRYIRDHLEETMSAENGGISTKSTLVFPVSSKDDKTLFECRAKSGDFPAATGNVTIRVKHKPEFVDPIKRVDAVEGSNISINVSVMSYPPVAWYSWTKDQSVIPPATETDGHVHRVKSAGNRLIITRVIRRDAGTYVCLAENEEGTSNATIILNVQYPATVINITNTVMVAEGDDAFFECSISANPITPDMVRWSIQGGGAILKENQQFTDNGKSLLTIFNVSKADSGSLECQAFNGLGKPDVKSSTLVVLYKPSIARNAITTMVAAELKSTAELSCVAEGDGNISFVWSYNTTMISPGKDGGRYDIRSAQTADIQWCSIMTIKRLRTEDLGEYTCVARSHLGYDVVKIQLIAKGPPGVPRDLKIQTETPNSVMLVWIPSFDGGSEQSFRIRYRKTGTPTYFYRETYANVSTYHLTGLVPGFEYEFQIAAYNDVGESAFHGDSVTYITKELTTAPPSNEISEKVKERREMNRMWLLTSIMGGLGFLFTCLFCVLMVWRRCSLITSEESIRSKIVAHFNSTMTPSVNMLIPAAQLQREDPREDMGNRLLIRANDNKTTASTSSVAVADVRQEHHALKEFQPATAPVEERTISWEDTKRGDVGRIRTLSYDRRSYEGVNQLAASKPIPENKGSADNIHAIKSALATEAPDILRNDNNKCLGESKEVSELSSSPRSTSPESPRYSSTTSTESSDTRSSVYHEKTSLHSLHSLRSLHSLHSLHSLRSTLSTISRSREIRGLEYITVKHSHPIVLINIEHGSFANADS